MALRWTLLSVFSLLKFFTDPDIQAHKFDSSSVDALRNGRSLMSFCMIDNLMLLTEPVEKSRMSMALLKDQTLSHFSFQLRNAWKAKDTDFLRMISKSLYFTLRVFSA
jgi:hypothetical protein